MQTEKLHASVSRAIYNSPLGIIEILAVDAGITALSYIGDAKEAQAPVPSRPALVDHSQAAEFAASNALSHLKLCLRQLDEYFHGARDSFTTPLVMTGTDFQKQVWAALLTLKCGETATYGDIANLLGTPGAARAVGQANNKNPIAIIVPCHRVIGADGSMTGYASGLWRKEWLLKHERDMTAGRAAIPARITTS